MAAQSPSNPTEHTRRRHRRVHYPWPKPAPPRALPKRDLRLSDLPHSWSNKGKYEFGKCLKDRQRLRQGARLHGYERSRIAEVLFNDNIAAELNYKSFEDEDLFEDGQPIPGALARKKAAFDAFILRPKDSELIRAACIADMMDAANEQCLILRGGSDDYDPLSESDDEDYHTAAAECRAAVEAYLAGHGLDCQD